jgi:hypothetical protein
MEAIEASEEHVAGPPAGAVLGQPLPTREEPSRILGGHRDDRDPSPHSAGTAQREVRLGRGPPHLSRRQVTGWPAPHPPTGQSGGGFRAVLLVAGACGGCARRRLRPRARAVPQGGGSSDGWPGMMPASAACSARLTPSGRAWTGASTCAPFYVSVRVGFERSGLEIRVCTGGMRNRHDALSSLQFLCSKRLGWACPRLGQDCWPADSTFKLS